MKAMGIAFMAIVVIAMGANLILETVGGSSKERATSSAVRLDN